MQTLSSVAMRAIRSLKSHSKGPRAGSGGRDAPSAAGWCCGDAELAADLTQTGASDEAMEEGLEKSGVSEPVAGREGL